MGEELKNEALKAEVAQFPSALRKLFVPFMPDGVTPVRYRVPYGGRGGTKSWGIARALLMQGTNKSQRTLCGRQYQNSIKDSVHKLLADQITALKMNYIYEVQNTLIKARDDAKLPDGSPNESEFIFKGFQQNMDEIIRGQTYAEQSARNVLTAKVNGFAIGPDGSYQQLPVSQRPQTLADLLKDPAAAKAWATMDPLQQAAINARIGKDDVPETQATISQFHELMGLAQVDPDGFSRVDFTAAKYMDTLPKANIMALQKEQLQMSSKQGRDLAKSSTWNNAMAIAKQVPGWKEAGLPMSIGPKTTDAQRGSYQQFGSRLYNMVQQYQGEHKKAIPHEEVVKMASSLLVQGTIPHSGFLWDTRTPVFNIAPNDSQRVQIATAFRRQLGRDPKPAEVDQIFQAHVLKNGMPK